MRNHVCDMFICGLVLHVRPSVTCAANGTRIAVTHVCMFDVLQHHLTKSSANTRMHMRNKSCLCSCTVRKPCLLSYQLADVYVFCSGMQIYNNAHIVSLAGQLRLWQLEQGGLAVLECSRAVHQQPPLHQRTAKVLRVPLSAPFLVLMIPTHGCPHILPRPQPNEPMIFVYVFDYCLTFSC